MARIRSIHPSLFTDERWIACSPLARLLYIGLLTEADDQGLFEWKPIQIKVKLLPLDNVDIPALLAELVDIDLIATLEPGGKKLGAIRKFRRFQRPKKPNAMFVLPPEWRSYVGLDDAGSELDHDKEEPVPNQDPPKPELAAQMEDGGGRRLSSVPIGTGADAPPIADPPGDQLADLRALPVDKGSWRLAVKVLVERGGETDARARDIVGKLVKDGLSRQDLWSVAEDAWSNGTLDPKPYLIAAARRIGERSSAPVYDIVAPTDFQQRMWCEEFRQSPNKWLEWQRGPRPGRPGCRVSPEILAEFGLIERAA